MGTLQYTDKWSQEQISKTFCQVNVFRSALFPQNTFHNVWLCCLVKTDIIFACSGKEKAMLQVCKSTFRSFIISLQILRPTVTYLFVCSFIGLFMYSFVEATALLKYLFWSCINKLDPLLEPTICLTIRSFIHSFICLFIQLFVNFRTFILELYKITSIYFFFAHTITHLFAHSSVHLFV